MAHQSRAAAPRSAGPGSSRIAVGPAKTPEWIRDAVRAAGCTLVDYADADALVWGDPRGADALGDVMRDHQQFRWVQLPFAGIENFVPHLDDRRVWTSGKGVYAEPVAELCMAFLLGGMRHVIGYSRVREWTVDHGRYLLGATRSTIKPFWGVGAISLFVVTMASLWFLVVILRRGGASAGNIAATLTGN